MKTFRHIAFLAGFAMLTSCNNYTKVLQSGSYEERYEVAKQSYAQGNYNRATILLQDVIAMFKGTDHAEESLYLLAMSAYKAKNYDAAGSYFKKYYESYPKGVYAEEAHFYVAMSLYNLTPVVRLDQTDTYTAVTEFQKFLDAYPTSNLRKQAQDAIFELQDKLVEKEYLTAKLYYDLGAYFGNCSSGGNNYQACIITAQNAIQDYPYTSLREDFAFLILKAKYDLATQSVLSKREERVQSAIDEYYGFLNEFPESKRLKEVDAIYKKLRPQVATATQDSTAIGATR